MAFKVQVGPPQIAIHQAMTVLVTETDGQINWPSDKGLYFFDTRLISAWSVYANGTPWDLLNGGAVNFDAARVFCLALEKAEPGSALHAVAEEGIPMRDIAEAIGAGLGIRARSIAIEEAPAYLGLMGGFFAQDNLTTSAITYNEVQSVATNPASTSGA